MSLPPQEIQKLNQLCGDIYGPDKNSRLEAEKQLQMFQSTQSLPKLKMIFESTGHPHTLFFGAQQLSMMFEKRWNEIPKDQTMAWKGFLCTYLIQRGANLPNHVRAPLFKVLGSIVKMGWHDDQAYRDLPEQIKKYFVQHANSQLTIIGLQILGAMIKEINSRNEKHTLTIHRKIACSFRDMVLRGMFESALFAIKEILNSPKQFQTPENVSVTFEALKLALECLQYDFVGIFPGESTEETTSIQIPNSWRPLFEVSNTLETFFHTYEHFPTSEGKKLVQEILVQLASVRRGLFTTEKDKVQYLSKFFSGMLKILRNKIGLNDQNCYHQFCRVLPKLKLTFALSEFLLCDNYHEWIQAVAEFTVESFQQWEYSSNSVYYLLLLWSKLLESSHAHYVSSDIEHKLEQYVPEIARQYILSRMEFAKGVSHGDGIIDNPLEHEEAILQQLDSFPQLAHCDYRTAFRTFVQVFDPTFLRYRQCIQNKQVSEFSVLEGQLSWISYMIGSCLGRKHVESRNTSDSLDIDAELSARIIRVMGLVNDRLQLGNNAQQSKSVQILELSCLSFLQHFKKVYLTESRADHTKFYDTFKRLLQVGDQLSALNIVVTKIANNLTIWSQNEAVIRESLTLFENITTGRETAQLSCKLSSTQFMLKNHTSQTFPFLNERFNLKHRMKFYKTLTRILFLESANVEQFHNFMKPIQTTFQELSMNPNPQDPRVQFAIVGMLRDLRGICSACVNKVQFTLFFDWLYPQKMPLFVKIVESLFASTDVMIALLKFLAEFSLSRGNRQRFGNMSAKGIILFRELSKIVTTYGKFIPKLQIPPDQEYERRYNLIRLCMVILVHAMSGQYCNFGVFEVYNDPSLSNSMNTIVKLALRIPKDQIQSYPKLKANFFSLVEVMFQHFLETVIEMDSGTVSELIQSMEFGIADDDVQVSTGISNALNSLCEFYVEHAMKLKDEKGKKLHVHLTKTPNVFSKILTKLFHLILYEDVENQWSISRVMLSLIVIDFPFFQKLSAQIIQSVKGKERQEKMEEAFRGLMKGVDTATISSTNSETFITNIISFRAKTRDII